VAVTRCSAPLTFRVISRMEGLQEHCRAGAQRTHSWNRRKQCNSQQFMKICRQARRAERSEAQWRKPLGERTKNQESPERAALRLRIISHFDFHFGEAAYVAITRKDRNPCHFQY